MTRRGNTKNMFLLLKLKNNLIYMLYFYFKLCHFHIKIALNSSPHYRHYNDYSYETAFTWDGTY
jgi:hypothetical protein